MDFVNIVVAETREPVLNPVLTDVFIPQPEPVKNLVMAATCTPQQEPVQNPILTETLTSQQESLQDPTPPVASTPQQETVLGPIPTEHSTPQREPLLGPILTEHSILQQEPVQNLTETTSSPQTSIDSSPHHEPVLGPILTDSSTLQQTPIFSSAQQEPVLHPVPTGDSEQEPMQYQTKATSSQQTLVVTSPQQKPVLGAILTDNSIPQQTSTVQNAIPTEATTPASTAPVIPPITIKVKEFANETKDQCEGGSGTDSMSQSSILRGENGDSDASPSAKEKGKVKPAFYFPDGSILKALLMSPLSFKHKIRNGIYQNGAYSTFPPESKSEPIDYDDHSNSISPSVLEEKFLYRKSEVGPAAVANMKKVNSFINKFGSELVTSPRIDEKRGVDVEAIEGTKKRLCIEDIKVSARLANVKREESETDENEGYDSDECIPSLNVEVELQEGEGVINSHNIDYFYNGTDLSKDLDNGEFHESNNGESADSKVGLSLEDLRCEVCGRQFNFKKNMNKHLRHMHGLGRFRCAVCPLEFEKRRDLIHHRDSHSESGEAGGGFKCEVCGKIIQWYNHFVQHRRTHQLGGALLSEERHKRHVCSTCSKGFRSAANLRVHVRTHTGERPFVCTVCGVSFAQKRIQVDHMNKHTGARPYECQECGERFSNYITYNVHKRTRHSMPNHSSAFACTMCDASFVWKSNLVSHMRSHTKEKVYSCSVCDKSFAHRNSLAYHKRLHSGTRRKTAAHALDQPAECFARRLLTVGHRRTPFGERTHVCVECGRLFSTKSTLVRHVRMQHAKEWISSEQNS